MEEWSRVEERRIDDWDHVLFPEGATDWSILPASANLQHQLISSALFVLHWFQQFILTFYKYHDIYMPRGWCVKGLACCHMHNTLDPSPMTKQQATYLVDFLSTCANFDRQQISKHKSSFDDSFQSNSISLCVYTHQFIMYSTTTYRGWDKKKELYTQACINIDIELFP